MSARAELARRATHLGHAMRAGLSPVWAVIGVLIVLIGGNIAISIAWGVRHLIWGVVIALVLLIVVITEGSYRSVRAVREAHSGELAAAHEARQQAQAELATAQAKEAPAAPAVKSGLEPVIEDEHPTPFPGIGLILEIEYSVINHDPVPHQLRPHLEASALYFPPPGDPDPEHVRFSQTYGAISQRRDRDRLPRRVKAEETVHGVYVIEFAWDPNVFRSLPDYTLIVGDGRREYRARPVGAREPSPDESGN